MHHLSMHACFTTKHANINHASGVDVVVLLQFKLVQSLCNMVRFRRRQDEWYMLLHAVFAALPVQAALLRISKDC